MPPLTAHPDDRESRKWWILLSIGTGSFLAALDASVINTILPILRKDLGSNVGVIQWVVTIYLLTVSALLLPLGRLGDLRGHRRTYAAGLVIFGLSSALCGLAWSDAALIGARALQALGGAMLFASSPAILTGAFPSRQRGRALGMQATMTYLGLTLGPSLGGLLTDRFGWRVVFFINIPVVAAALTLCLTLVPRDRPAARGEPFDPAGAVLFAAGLVALLLGLNRGHDWGWSSAGVVGLLAAAAGLLAGFLSWQRRAPHPMLDLTLFHRPRFALCVAGALLNYASIYTITFLLPFYLIDGRGLSAKEAGLLLSVQPLVMAVVAPISGALSDRTGPRLLSSLGMAVLAAGAAALASLGPGSSLAWAGVGLALTGLGTGVFIAPNNSAMMGSAPPERQGIAAGVLATSRNVGMVLGVGLAGAIYTTLTVQGDPSKRFVGVSAGLIAASVVALAGGAVSAVRTEAPPPR